MAQLHYLKGVNVLDLVYSNGVDQKIIDIIRHHVPDASIRIEWNDTYQCAIIEITGDKIPTRKVVLELTHEQHRFSAAGA